MSYRLAQSLAKVLCLGSLVMACATSEEAAEERSARSDELSARVRPGIMPMTRAVRAKSAPSDARLLYRGGPVISAVKVYAVYWGTSVPDQADLDSFYGDVTNSAHLDWLREYNTPTQTIGRGSFGGSVVDATAPAGAAVTDEQIRAEITKLIDTKMLPAPDANSLYMVHFPPGVSISIASRGASSCVDFCAYHDAFPRNGQNLYYGVVPDLGGMCEGGCGTGTKFENQTMAASHELVEAVTDPEVGLTETVSAPRAWYDERNGEIGDICDKLPSVIGRWTVQQEFSNRRNSCIATDETPSALSPNDCLFDWAEVAYPSLFAPARSTTLVSSPYTYRHYSETGAYLGVSSSDNHVYFLGADGKLLDVGPLSTLLTTAGCP